MRSLRQLLKRRPPPPAEAESTCIRCNGPREELDDRFCINCLYAVNNSTAGFVRGKHFTEYVDEVKQLKREKRHPEAEVLLLELIEATEREAEDRCYDIGPAPWYTEHLAIVYRKDRRYADEISICERYEQHPGCDGAFSDRLPKARELLTAQASDQ